MAYAIMRTKKLKTPGNLAASASHIERTRPTHNADLTISNEWLGGTAPGMYAKAKEVWDQIPKKRSDAVHGIEVLLTASPEAFSEGLDLDAWKEQSMTWLRQQFKGCELVGACLHLDESTPHIQAILIPTDKAPDGTLKLNCKKYLGSAQKLSMMQTSYAKAVESLGLERGLKGSKAKHVTIAQFYQGIAKGSGVKFKPFAVESPPVLLTGKARDAWANAQTAALKKDLSGPIKSLRSEASRANDLGKRNNDLKRSNSALSLENTELKRQRKEEADKLRTLPLEQVAAALGCYQTAELKAKDVHQFESPVGKINIDGQKFFNVEDGKGGGGAFDLVMHVNDCTYTEALAWLRDSFDPSAAVRAAVESARLKAEADVQKAPPAPFKAPEHVPGAWPRVREYLTQVRSLAGSLIDKLRDAGWLGADQRNNAYFIKAKGNTITSAELRGTGRSRFKGSRGRSSEGVFPVMTEGARKLAVCEGAIDAITYVQLHDGYSAIATCGTGKYACADEFIKEHGHRFDSIVCASDRGPGGEGMAQALGLPHAPPPAGFGDWNEFQQAASVNPALYELIEPKAEASPRSAQETPQKRSDRRFDDDPALG